MGKASGEANVHVVEAKKRWGKDGAKADGFASWFFSSRRDLESWIEIPAAFSASIGRELFFACRALRTPQLDGLLRIRVVADSSFDKQSYSNSPSAWFWGRPC